MLLLEPLVFLVKVVCEQSKSEGYSPHTDPMSLAADIEELLSRECTDCMDGNSSKLLEQKVINVGEMGLSANALDDLEKATEQLVL